MKLIISGDVVQVKTNISMAARVSPTCAKMPTISLLVAAVRTASASQQPVTGYCSFASKFCACALF